MATKRFNLKQAPEPNKLNRLFSFSGKVRGSDVLLRLVDACGYEVVHKALEQINLNAQFMADAFAIADALDAENVKKPASPAKPQPKSRKPPRPPKLPTESSIQPPRKSKMVSADTAHASDGDPTTSGK